MCTAAVQPRKINRSASSAACTQISCEDGIPLEDAARFGPPLAGAGRRSSAAAAGGPASESADGGLVQPDLGARIDLGGSLLATKGPVASSGPTTNHVTPLDVDSFPLTSRHWLLRLWVETSNTSLNGTGASCVAQGLTDTKSLRQSAADAGMTITTRVVKTG
jgi:hypothetical protein